MWGEEVGEEAEAAGYGVSVGGVARTGEASDKSGEVVDACPQPEQHRHDASGADEVSQDEEGEHLRIRRLAASSTQGWLAGGKEGRG